MSLSVYSAFRYGHTVTDENKYLDFNEGGDDLVAEIDIGSYSLTEYLEKVAEALNDVGENTYSLEVDYDTGFVTLNSDNPVDILGESGANASQNCLGMLGIEIDDYLAVEEVEGTSRSGSIYYPQFFLQGYKPTSQSVKAAFATVTKSASGRVSVQSFGQERLMRCDLVFITNLPQPSDSLIKNNEEGYEDALDFLEYLITKAPIEFIPDLSKLDEFETMILESTPSSPEGTGFELEETYSRGLPYFYEIKPLTFRLIEES